MKQNEITIGMVARVRIGDRLAPVTVEAATETLSRIKTGLRRVAKYRCLVTDSGRRITCTAARLRRDVAGEQRAARLPHATHGTNGQPLETAAPVPGMVERVTAAPVERLGGGNLRGVERIVGTVHVSASWRSACRAVFQKVGTGGASLREFPRPLRRGLWLAVAEAHKANRDLYRHVMGTGPTPSADAVERAMLGDAAARAEVLAQ